MLSIFVMYSPDRKPQMQQMIECMRDMELYDQADKIILVDGEPNFDDPDWRFVKVPRTNGSFNWSKMWDVGVQESYHDVILYLDSDRILPRHYLQTILDRIEDNCFLFCHDLFNFLRHVDTNLVKIYRDTLTPVELKRRYDEYKNLLWYDPRHRLPCHGPAKGVMSGNTAFTKITFEKSGGVDPWYHGMGAWADNDYHQQCWEMGMKMVDMGCLELHLYHEKLDVTGEVMSRNTLETLCLTGYVHYCLKWNLSLDRARSIAKNLGLDERYVKQIVDACCQS